MVLVLHMPKEKKAQADKLGKQIVDQRGESIDWSKVENFIKEAAHFENVRVAIVEPGSTKSVGRVSQDLIECI